MPMLDVRIVGEPSGPSARARSLARRLADVAADVMHSSPKSVWLTVELLPLDRYAENGDQAAPADLPVYIKISRMAVDGPDVVGPEAAALTRAFAAACGRSEKAIRIFYQVVDRVSLGGTLVG
ncbi:MAG TPA: hypothetical protein VKB80_01590 [Kofleriaceae bacterium]|nr:hypothetical protein [Kofleriaceae bacterium]